MAMVIGMAAFGESFYGHTRPKRDAIVEELVQAVLFGHQRAAAASPSKRAGQAKPKTALPSKSARSVRKK
jgi:hypothetical protein